MWVYLRNRLNKVELANEDKRKGSRMQYLTPDQVKGYTVHRKISEGGFGEVYLATETRPNFEREVVLKRILPKFGNDPRFIQRFESEARTIARLEYPYIVPLYDYWRNPDGAYLVMRWLKGGSVKDRLESGPLDLETAVRIVNHVCSALALSHRNGVIHRDVKPGNILLDEEGNAFLSDFGIAKDFMKFDSNTQPEDIIGSPKYISPEQARNDPVTPRTDVYSLGVTLYEMLAGEHPFPNANMYDLIYKHLNEPLPLLTSLDAAVQADINVVIQQATEKNPANRYEHAIDFARAFQAAAQLETTTRTENIEQQLTIREQQTLCLLMKGMTNKEIAAGLFVEHDTVRWHLRNAYKKLGVSRREQAIVVARTLNLVCEDGTVLSDGSTSYVIEFEPENPYKGLEAFSYADASNFYGREKVVEKLLMRLEQDHPHNRFLAVLGPSGSGKSSLVKAGLVPARWESESGDDGKWLVTDMFPSEHPVDELDIALRRVAARHADGLSDLLTHNERGLVKAAQLILPDNQDEILLIIDQFEEVFTQVESEEERVHFLNLITNAVMDRASRMRIVITIRADYFDRPLYYPQFGDILRDRVETVLPLSAEELEQAIVQPARKVGVKFEDGLVASIVSDIHYQPGALPLLQYALTELFDRRDGRKITREGYEQIGGAAGAIASTAEELFQSYNETGQETIRQMFLRLVTLGEGAEDTRRRTGRDELLSIAVDSYLMDEIIDTFAYARMLSLDNDPTTREPTVEVAHEAILREWERLRTWLNDSRDDIKTQRQLAALSAEWEKHTRSNDYLVRGTRLDQLQLWSSETSLTLTPSEQAFLDASIAEREQRVAKEQAQAEREANLQLRARRVLQGLVAVFLIAAVISVGFGYEANRQRGIAEENEITARQEGDKASQQAAILLADRAQRDAEDGYYDRAVLLALEVLRNYPYVPEAEHALAQAVTYNRTLNLIDAHIGAGTSVSWSPDGTQLATTGTDNIVRIWDATSGNKLLEIDLPLTTGRALDLGLSVIWSPDGQSILTLSGDRFVVGTEDYVMTLWDVTTGKELRTFAPSDLIPCEPDDQMCVDGTSFVNYPTASAIEFSPISGRLATINGFSTAVIWDISIENVEVKLSSHDAPVNGVAWSPDEAKIATFSEDGTARIWNTETGEMLMTLVAHEGGVNSTAWSPDGTELLTGGDDGTIKVWDIETGQTRLDIAADEEIVWSVTWAPDGKRLISANQDATVRIWNATSGRELTVLRGHRNWITDMDWSTTGELLATTSFDGVLRLWNVAESTALASYPEIGPMITGFGWSPNGEFLSVDTANYLADDGEFQENKDAAIAIIDGETNEHTHDIGQGYWFWTESIFNNNDQEMIATGLTNCIPCGSEGAQEPVVMDVLSGNVIREFPRPEGNGRQAYSPDLTRIVRSDQEGNVYVWDLQTGELIEEFRAHDGWIVALEWSPDDTMYATGGYRDGGYVKIWNANTHELLWEMDGHTPSSSITRVAWSPNSQKLLSISGNPEEGSLDYSARIWDAETGEQLVVFDLHNDTLSWGKWSPDGTRIVTTSFDDTTRIWDAATGAELLTLITPGDWWNRAEWSPDGTRLFVGGAWHGPMGQMWRVWQTTEELIDYAKECCVFRDLTQEERQQFGLPPRDG